MLPALKKPRPKDQPEIASLLQSHLQLQKSMMQKSESHNASALNLIAQSFQQMISVQKEMKDECTNIAALLGRMVKLQTHAVKAEKNTLEEIKEMNRGMRDSEKGETPAKRNQSLEASQVVESDKIAEKQRQRFSICEQFQINFVSQVIQKESQNKQITEVSTQPKQVHKDKVLPKEKLLQLIEAPRVYREVREQQVIIPVKSCQFNVQANQLDSIKEVVNVWVGKTFDSLIKQSFNGYIRKDMQQSEAKVFFSQNLMLNFLELLNYLQKEHFKIWQQHKDTFMEHYQKKAQQTLTYYLVKYPQKNKIMIDPSIKKSIRPCNYSQSPQFNIISNLNCEMRYNPSGDYSNTIKVFLNALITESSKNFIQFKSIMRQIFTFTKESGEKYQVDNLIGMKIREGTPLYSEQQIKKKGVQIKTPEILRVIMKWIEELQEIIEDPYLFFGKDTPFPNRVKTKVASGLSEKLSANIITLLRQIKYKFDQQQKENKQLLTSVCKQLFGYCSAVTNQFSNIVPSEIKKTLPVYAVSQVVASTAISNLNQLIHTINSAINRSQQMLRNMLFEDLELIPFSVSDLLRCKCSCTVKQVVEVVKRLEKHEKLTIVRIKDRLNTGNQDFLINIKMNNCAVLCEVQVGFKTKADEKMEFLDHFNHFLYELARSEYGPLAQSTLIASNLTHFNGFYDKTLKNIQHDGSIDKNLVIVSKNADQIQCQGWKTRDPNFSFVCSSCLMLQRAHSTFLKVLQKNDEFICGQCTLKMMKPEDISRYFLGKVLGQFFEYQTSNKQRLSMGMYKVIIHKQQRKSLRIITDNPLFLAFSHVFYEFNQQIFYFENDIKIFDKSFAFGLKPEVHIKRINTNQLVKEISQDHFVKLSKVVIIDRDEMGQKLPEYLKQSKKLHFAQQHLTIQHIKKCPTLYCLTCQKIPFNLIIDCQNPEFNISNDAKKYVNKMEIEKVTKSNNMTWDLESLAIEQKIVQNIQIKHSLKRLKLNKNNISSLNLFKCESLQQLYLNQNRISKIESYDHFPSLRILEIDQNILESLQNIDTFSQLRVLSADQNQIKTINLNKLPPSLQKLSLKKNQIQIIRGQCNHPSLLYLNLQQNRVKQANFESIVLSNLTQLNLSRNFLSRLILPDKNFMSLTHLYASFNRLLSEVGVSGIRTLQYIEIQYCKLAKINFQGEYGNYKISVIKLRSNQLKQFKLGTPSPNLESISLDFNRLQQLDLNPIGPLQNLTTLEVTYNKIKKITFTPPKTKFKLKSIRLTGNPLSLKFSSSIKRSDAPQLEELWVGNTNATSQMQFAEWLLHTLPEEKTADFIKFFRKEKQQDTDIEDQQISKIQFGFRKILLMRDRDTKSDFIRLVRKYFGQENQVTEPNRNLALEGNSGQYFIQADI